MQRKQKKEGQGRDERCIQLEIPRCCCLKDHED